MKRIALLLAAICCSASLWAQTLEEAAAWKLKADTVQALRQYKAKDNWFIGIQAGANHSLSDNARFGSFGAMTKPSVAISVGKYFAPAVGARLQFAYLKQMSRANSEVIEAYPQVFGNGNYGFNMFSGYLDGLFNLNNIFGQYDEDCRFNVVGILGMGVNTTFGFDDKVKEWGANSPAWGNNDVDRKAPYEVCTDSKALFALRAGLQFNYILSNTLDLNLEATFNATDDGLNGVRYDRKWDSYANVMLGLTYHFKDQYGDRRFRYTKVTDQAMVDELNRKINEEREKTVVVPAPVITEVKKEVVKNELLGMTVSFKIDKYNITDIQKKNVAEAAKYLEEHPEVNLIVTGYADVQTGNPAYNLKLSQKRAEAVSNMMVKEFGVDPSRIRVDYKGDSLQPYQLKNEWNRVVVFITEARNP